MKNTISVGIFTTFIVVASVASCSRFVGRSQAELQATTANSATSLENINVAPTRVAPGGSKKLPIHASRDPNSPTGVFIPKTMSEAVAELWKSLPFWYTNSLSRSDSNGAIGCRSNNEDNDLLVIDWMKQFWMLRSKESEIVKSSQFELRGEMFPDLVANSILDNFCLVVTGA